MDHHSEHSENQERGESQGEPVEGAEEGATHEVDPADNPGPRGSGELDSERAEQVGEDLDGTLPG